MTWSYSEDPMTSALDATRFLLQDTDVNDQQMSNEEILWLLAESGNIPAVAARRAALTLASKYTGMASSKTIGDLSIDYGDRAARFTQIADDLAPITGGVPTPSAGGISISEKRSVYADKDRDGTAITPGMHDFQAPWPWDLPPR